MSSVIQAPDEQWLTYIAKMWLLGSQIAKDVLGEEMDGSPADLQRLQRLIDSREILSTNTQELQALGIVFGKVFVNETPNYDWWVVEDEYGEDACIRYKQTSLVVFPQTMLSKRIEDGEEVNVQMLYVGLRERLESIRKQNYADA